MSLTLKQVRYFIATAETGQISHAAMEMNISQSAVTAAIQQLEAQLGVKLLERTPSGVRPTIEGARFLNHARNIAAAVEDAVRSPLGEGRRVSGKLRVVTTYTVAGYFMARHYTRFRRAYPDIEIEMMELPRGEIEKGIVSGWVDLAVMLVSNLANQDEIESETLFRSRRRLWLPADHPLLGAPRVTLAEVAAEPYVMLTVDEARVTAGRYWEVAGLAPNVIFSTSSVEAVRSLAAAGGGGGNPSGLGLSPLVAGGAADRPAQSGSADPQHGCGSCLGARAPPVTGGGDLPGLHVGRPWRRRLTPDPRHD